MNSNHYQLFTILIGFRTASPDTIYGLYNIKHFIFC